jgi:hypothetical protein
MVHRVLNGNVAGQPKNVSITRFNLGLVLVVRLNVSVRNGVGVVRIHFMDVFRRNGDRGYHPGREGEDEGKMPN